MPSSPHTQTVQLQLEKVPERDSHGQRVMVKDPAGGLAPKLLTGFRFAGGIDQDRQYCPYGYPDCGIYVTHVYSGSPADKAGLRVHDKILQVNGNNLAFLGHAQVAALLNRETQLSLLVHRGFQRFTTQLSDSLGSEARVSASVLL
ncbi:hypothetical protein BOX15_Mlig003908g1 [Macrostomum lignano]|uniref:PDZ domain-containing protein n=1 Tax=Macrostomum lignano TaxID=282301 RepID=A0A267G641_9PLAT|nr:hypothetical protein BOX15_Mlig003908g1 [Macrostomum lignano]